MRLTVLGCSSPCPGPGEAGSGYLLEDRGQKLLLDCGSGVIANLQYHCGLKDLDAVVITHFHPDHCVDLFTLGFGLMMPVWQGNDPSPVRLILPPGGIEVFRQLSGFMGDLWKYYDLVFDMEEFKDGRRLDLSTMSLEFRQMKHSMAAHGVRVTGSAVLAYSGDTAFCPQVVELAQKADLFLAEAGMLDEARAGEANHMTPNQAGKAARAANVNTLVLTHLPPQSGDRHREEAARSFGGRVLAASVGMVVEA